MEMNQIFVKLLDGRTRCIQIPSATVSGEALKQYILARTGIPLGFQRLVSGSREIGNETLIAASEDGIFPSCSLLLRLRGGKGGFGSLLRGAATKAGQKKTRNFDACRDMSGRRLRHVNAEKKLEEWKAEEEGRKLEKLADQYLKSKTKLVKKNSEKDVSKYIEKYKEDSAKCMEEVEESVRQSFALYEKSKRKALPSSGNASKRLHIWLGKKKVEESDSDEENDEDDEESIVLDGDATVSSSQSDQDVSGEGSEKGNLEEAEEEEEEEEEEDNTAVDKKALAAIEGSIRGIPSEESLKSEQTPLEEDQTADSERKAEEQRTDSPASTSSDLLEQKKAPVAKKIEKEISDEPLEFDEYNSAGDLEVLGMERLKSELQSRGLKCGGTLQERAARLFLLKSTPIDKLPKKLLAKPPT